MIITRIYWQKNKIIEKFTKQIPTNSQNVNKGCPNLNKKMRD